MAHLSNAPKVFVVVLSLLLEGIVGGADYLTGFEISFSTFYLAPIALSAWLVGGHWAVFIATTSIVIELLGDAAAGIHYSNNFVLVWNAIIKLFFYLVVVWLILSWRRLHGELEARVLHRTAALTEEMTARERLEKELLEVVEKERRRIGQDLHDSLCQHLTGTALAGQVLQEKLTLRSLPEAATAQQIVSFIEEAIELTRTLSRGLHPVALEEAGVSTAFRELAAVIAERFQISCICECLNEVRIEDIVVATHLYRIAQESISNAIKHGRARRIVIKLNSDNNRTTLSIEDDGNGLPADWQRSEGMGMRIMEHRSAMIGAKFNVNGRVGGGTVISCSLLNSLT